MTIQLMPEVSLAAQYPNLGARSSGKTRDLSAASRLKLAATIALQVGMVRTWPNLQTIRLAMESEAACSSISFTEAAELIVKAAKERTYGDLYRPSTPWEIRAIYRANVVDRFWFEDARWRGKDVYLEFLGARATAKDSACEACA